VARTRASRLLNVAVVLPLADRGTNDTTKTPDLVTAEVWDENFVVILVRLIFIQSIQSAHNDQGSQTKNKLGVGEQILDEMRLDRSLRTGSYCRTRRNEPHQQLGRVIVLNHYYTKNRMR
jgi:hypothetical protein